MTLTELLDACIDAKQGDTELALFYFGEDGDESWRCEIGNRSQHVTLGEVRGQFRAWGDSPEAAARNLLHLIEQYGGVAPERSVEAGGED